VIIIFTNRKLVQAGVTAGDERMFGESQNLKGSSELRIALAEKDLTSGKWSLTLQEEKGGPRELPSQILFCSVLTRIREGSVSPKWVVAVHGYGQSFLDSLEEAHSLEQRYQGSRQDEQINVIMFSWPSRPGGIILDPVNAYRRAQAAAVPSSAALSIALQRVWNFLAIPALRGELATARFEPLEPIPGFSLCLHVHSQGNLVVEMMVRTKALEGTQIRLDTITLHQADVDTFDHRNWVDMLHIAGDVVITLNAFDRILRLSDAINPERIGIARTELNAHASYFDFTGGSKVGSEHNLFLGVDNKLVKLFCQRALTGFPVHQMGGASSGFRWDESVGAWRLGVRPSGPQGGAQRPDT
jgi:hypothetical protein